MGTLRQGDSSKVAGTCRQVSTATNNKTQQKEVHGVAGLTTSFPGRSLTKPNFMRIRSRRPFSTSFASSA
eukprot:903327-Pelagomonas_calceolata.AAC.1